MQETEHDQAISTWNRVFSRLRPIGISPQFLLVVAMLAIAPLFIKDEYILHLMVVSLLYGSQAIAFDFTAGFINVVNFGLAAFVGIGAYTSALLVVRLGASPWIGFAVGTFAAALLGFITGLLTLRLRGLYAAVMAWFVGLALMALTAAFTDLTRGYLGLSVPLFLKTIEMRPYFYILLPITILTYVVLRAVTNSHIGLAFRAIGQNLRAARVSGVDPTKYRVLNFTLSCAVCGMLGVFYAHFVGILTPDVMATAHTVEVLALSYIGGRGTLWGGLLAAFLVIPTFEYLKPLMEIRLILYGVLLILVMILYPAGLAGILQRVGELLKRRLWRG